MTTTFPHFLPSFSLAVLAQNSPASRGRISRYVRIDEGDEGKFPQYSASAEMCCRLESSLVHFQIIRCCQDTAERDFYFSNAGSAFVFAKENVGECQLQIFSNDIPASGADTRGTKEEQME
ncbi:hypothetical protein DFH11DRAFT_1618377 [Phellopilus nigrolimitatus]|nr:hypothetical protein DFH11DRAFT_1618377 [Phellopilus nigrolimitatus]